MYTLTLVTRVLTHMIKLVFHCWITGSEYGENYALVKTYVRGFFLKKKKRGTTEREKKHLIIRIYL